MGAGFAMNLSVVLISTAIFMAVEIRKEWKFQLIFWYAEMY